MAPSPKDFGEKQFSTITHRHHKGIQTTADDGLAPSLARLLPPAGKAIRGQSRVPRASARPRYRLPAKPDPAARQTHGVVRPHSPVRVSWGHRVTARDTIEDGAGAMHGERAELGESTQVGRSRGQSPPARVGRCRASRTAVSLASAKWVGT
jgi:hypothetical protein